MTLEEKYLVSMETPLTTTGGQGKLKDFLDENKYIYAPTAVLDVDLFLDRILPGARRRSTTSARTRPATWSSVRSPTQRCG